MNSLGGAANTANGQRKRKEQPELRKILCDICHGEIERVGDVIFASMHVGSSVKEYGCGTPLETGGGMELCEPCARRVVKEIERCLTETSS